MMSIIELAAFFGWCSVINIGVLCFSSLCILMFKDVIVSIHSRVLGVDKKDLPRLYFQYLAIFKVGVILLNIVPYIALRLMM